jgi:hypothetical protein
VRSLRRWLIVTAVWAVAATGIAVLAYLTANDDDAEQAAESSTQVRRADRQLQQRINALQAQFEELPSAATITDYDRRIKQLSRVAARQDKNLSRLNKAAQDMSDQLTALQQAANDAEQQNDENGTP